MSPLDDEYQTSYTHKFFTLEVSHNWRERPKNNQREVFKSQKISLNFSLKKCGSKNKTTYNYYTKILPREEKYNNKRKRLLKKTQIYGKRLVKITEYLQLFIYDSAKIFRAFSENFAKFFSSLSIFKKSDPVDGQIGQRNSVLLFVFFCFVL